MRPRGQRRGRRSARAINALAALITAAPSVVALSKTAAPVALAVAARARSVPLAAYAVGLSVLVVPVCVVVHNRAARVVAKYRQRQPRYRYLRSVAGDLQKPKELDAANAVIDCLLMAETDLAYQDHDFPRATFSKDLNPLFLALRIHVYKDWPRRVKMERYDRVELAVVAKVIRANMDKFSGISLAEAALERNSIANMSEQEWREAGLPDLR